MDQIRDDITKQPICNTAVRLFSSVLRIIRRAWLLAIFSAVLQIVIFPLADLYILSWIAIAPLLIAILRARPAAPLQLQGAEKLLAANPQQSFLLGYVCGILWYAGTCYWVF